MPKNRTSARAKRRRGGRQAATMRPPPERSRLVPQAPMRTAVYRQWLIKTVIGYTLVAVAVVMTVAHMAEHFGRLKVLPTTGMQDLLTGYPMAGAIFIAACVILTGRN